MFLLTIAGPILLQVIAAHRKGICRVILPYRNFVRDLDALPPAVRSDVEFIPVKRVEEVLNNALVGGFPEIFHPQSKI